MSTTTSFDIRVRTLECQHCGAPVATQQRGGTITCRYCGVVNVLQTRLAAAGAGTQRSLTEEVARLSRLKAQLAHPISGHAYKLSEPPMGWRSGEVEQPAGMERAAAEWRNARATPSPLAAEQRKLCWLSMKLADGYRQRGEVLKARAVLETALDVLADDGHRQLVRCRLAAGAIREGDLESAAGWLDECDPFPEVLELDSAYREAQALLHAARGDGPALLGVVGSRASDVPVASEHARTMTLLRIHGLELTGYDAEAYGELERAAGDASVEQWVLSLGQRGLAPRTVAKATQRSLEAKLDLLLRQRTAISGGLVAALLSSLMTLPFLAAALTIPITISRCVADADPLLGAYGNPLCDKVCERCHGPVRVVTTWNQTGPGEYSSDGAEYYCPSDKNGIGEMSDEEIEQNSYALAPYRLNFIAAQGAGYLLLLLVLLPLVPFQTFARWSSHRAQLGPLNVDVEEVAQKLGVRAPPPPSADWKSVGRTLAILLGAAGGAALLVVLGMWLG